MSKFLVTASAFALLTGPAAALTAPELWEDWQATMSRLGSELSAESEDYADGTLTLTGVTGTGTFAGTTSTTGYGNVTLIEQSDGSVRIEVPTEVSTNSVVEIDGQRIETSATMIMQGLDAIARDEGEDRVYDVSASEFGYQFDQMPGSDGEVVDMSMTVTEYDTMTRFGPDDSYEGTFSGALSVSLTATGTDAFSMTYTAQGLQGDMTGTIPEIPASGEVTDFGAIGLAYAFTMTHSGSQTSIAGQTEDGPLSIEGTSGGGSMAVALAAESLSYGLSSTDVSMTVVPPAMPLPIAFSAAEMGSELAMPLTPGDAPSPFSLGVTLQDVAVDESLWALFDPTGQLPRDPATVELDLAGTATVVGNLLDPAAMETLAGPPLLPRTVDLTKLLVSAAGAELRGTGDLEWADVMTNPMPLGTLTLELDGGFGLLDKLVALGFVPPQQVAIVRGMAGAVAETVGDDQLRSELGFTPQGITANGLPLPF